MVVGHRWEYDYNLRQTECVGLPIGGVESHQWCIGCGCIITDLELCKKRLPRENPFCDILALQKGCLPIEAGTLEEYRMIVRNGRKQREYDISG